MNFKPATIATLFFATIMTTASAQTSPASEPVTVLNREQASVMPATVFFRGQTATTQLRNSAGLRIGTGKDPQLLLTALVDTGGYSTAVQEKYQAYLLTEVPLHFGMERGSVNLPPGAYGFGFLANGRMTIMDIGGREVASAITTKDPALARPNPLQILPDAQAGGYRLYLGRSYVFLSLSGHR